MEDLKKARPGDGGLSAFAARGPAGVFDGMDIDFPLSEYMEKKMECQGNVCLDHAGRRHDRVHNPEHTSF